ncbi:hypothetical protein MXB_4409, partial [Myxobolus squamalis]
TLFIKYLYLKYKVRKQTFIKEKYLCIDKVLGLFLLFTLELVNERLCNHKKGIVDTPYIPVVHIRDLLFLRTEVQRISGQDFQVWKWIGIPLEPNLPLSSLGDQISSTASLYDSLTSFLKIYIGECTSYFFFNNPSFVFHEMVANLIKEIKQLNLIIIQQDSFPNKFVLYLKMRSKEDAIQVFNHFNKSNKFGPPLKVKFMAEYFYNQRCK